MNNHTIFGLNRDSKALESQSLAIRSYGEFGYFRAWAVNYVRNQYTRYGGTT